MDTILWGLLVATAFLGLFGLIIGVAVFAAAQHEWGLLAAVSGIGMILVLVMAAGRERRHRWHKEEQRKARGL
jgi:hypothetical protein